MHFPRLASLAAVLGLLGAAVAQGPATAWDIPARGAHVYRRTTHRFEVTPPPSKLACTVVVPGGQSREPQRWRTWAGAEKDVPTGFELPGFDDAAWPVGPAGFGTDVGTDARQRTTWNQPVLCLRTPVDLGRSKPKALWLRMDHDDGIRVWLNGKLILADDGYGRDRWYVVADKALDAWQRGDNLLAVRCNNVGGAQYLDVEVAAFASLPRGVRRAEELLQAVRNEQQEVGRVRGALFGAYRPPPMLLEGELDPEREYVLRSPADLREIAWWVATDLRTGVLGGTIASEARRLYELGDLRIKGKAGKVDPDGWQTIEATVRNTAEPSAGDDSNRYVDRFVKPYVHYGFDGALRIRRRLEVRETGVRVVAFESDLEGSILTGKDWKEVAAGFVQQESWTLDHSHENQDAAFRALVQQAIDKGTAQLRKQLENPGGDRLQAQAADGDNSYHSGRLAIGVLALLKGGLPKDDEVVARCLAELRQRTLIDTYSLGNGLMALEALYAPESEVSMLKSGAIDRPRKRTPSPEDKALMQRWTERLLTNVDTRVDPAYLLRFNYTGGQRFDNSVHQYGLLGLYAAHLCGVDVSPTVWEAAANHLLDAQVDNGRKLQLELLDYRSHARREADPDATFTTAKSYGHSNGWGYHGAKDGGEDAEVWGSMTCAGITGLAICQAALQDHPDVKRPKLQSEATRARNDGFAWLADNLTVRHHPGALTRQQRWLYYYLYSLERAALLSGIALIQGRDWYFEGAMMLVLAQQPDGGWAAELSGDEAIERNAMAILFLKQSTRPVLTGR